MFENIIEHQVILELKERGLKKGDLSAYEWLSYKYKMALRLLEELG
jgi:hypothetical protein